MATLREHDWTAVARLIDSFEAVRREESGVNLADFFPESTHPLRREVAAELIRVDLEYSWAHGERKSLDEYRAVAHEVFDDPSLLAGAAFEEFRLRRLAGERVQASEYAERFGIAVDDWPEVEPSMDGRHGDCPAGVPIGHPQPGETFAGFHLVAVLGRGAFATVFLARQADLARRFVALKVTSRRSMEPQHLARLQHTNIVPIYSLHEENGLLAVCMPYFGDRTLADVITGFSGGESLPVSGQAFVSTNVGLRDETMVDGRHLSSELGTSAKSAVSPSGKQDIKRKPYVDSVIELVGEIAAGLQHAHERGVVHRDLKPANILLTCEGRPLLLDFNLSEDLVVNGSRSLEIGGTLPYMGPEHLLAIRDGGNVDARSDIFSLGVIMYELLTGRLPYATRRVVSNRSLDEMINDRSGPPPAPRHCNPAVSPSVDAIVRKCLEPNPNNRYGSAHTLSDDLQCQLHNLPLKHAGNPSLVERLGKWKRRHPRAMSAASLSLVTAVLLAVFAALWTARSHYVARLEAQQNYEQFVHQLTPARMAASPLYMDDALLVPGLERINKTLSLYGLPESKDFRSSPSFTNLPATERVTLSEQLVDLAYLAAQGETTLSRHAQDTSSTNNHLERAIRFNDIARYCSADIGVPRAVSRQRDKLLQQLGRRAELSWTVARKTPSPLDDYLNAQALLGDRSFAEAKALLEPYVAQHPTDPVVWLLLGNAIAGLGELPQAEGCYTTAIALQPESYIAIYNRAMCRQDQGHFGEAFRDFERVLRLRPELPCVLLNRALAYEESGDLRRAAADLDAAIVTGKTPPRAYFLRSRIRTRLGDAAGAESDRLEGLKREPADDVGWVAHGMARLSDDPKGALDDFRRALNLNDRSILALKNVVHVAADRLNRADEALDALNRWHEIDPANPAPIIGRAVLKGRSGIRNEALADVDAALAISQEPTILFQAACALSLTSKPDNHDAARGLLLLSRSVELDYRLARRAESDPDLATLRGTPEFATLMELNRKSRHLQRSLISDSIDEEP
jgi:serine/threonine protein kinase/Flp pilus assembly protein TadD